MYCQYSRNSRNKKVGGLTWWRNNYGSILQAYALQQTLNQHDGIDYEIINQYSVKIASLSNLILKIKENGFISTTKRLFFRFGMRKLRRRVDALQSFISDKLILSDQVYQDEIIHDTNLRYDAFICGSDQIWNPANVSLNSVYWLGFVENNKKKFSYAASIGINEADKEQAAIIKENLSSFDGISCREDDGTSLINKILGEDVCETVLDPTLVVENKLWDELSRDRLIDEKYIFAYMLRGTKADRKLVEQFAKEKRLKIVTIPFLDAENIEWYDMRFGDIKVWDASPSDFISLIRYSEYVFTDSFHCMIFSIRYHRIFYTFKKIGKAQMSRIHGLQAKLDIGSRMINSHMNVEDVKKLPDILWNDVDNALNRERQISQEYLDRIVKIIKSS